MLDKQLLVINVALVACSHPPKFGENGIRRSTWVKSGRQSAVIDLRHANDAPGALLPHQL